MKRTMQKVGGMVVAAALAFLVTVQPATANNIAVTNVALVNQDRGAKTLEVNFDLRWDNSWRAPCDNPAYTNWDAAWVFIKFKAPGSNKWEHALLSTSGHTAVSGSAIAVGTTDANGVGAFVYSSGPYTGRVNYAGTRLLWNYGANGYDFAAGASVTVSVQAIEMVYVPQGSFEAGDGQSDQNQFTKTLINTPDPTVVPEGSPLAGGYPSGGGSYAAAAPSTTNWPNGWNAFYCMKYEITQGQYTDFLNLLTATQDATRYPNFLNQNGYTIGGSAGSRTNTAPDRACFYLTWQDGAAFADWAGLRPMTELEFEKACRGPTAAVAGEYAWGTTTKTTISSLQGTDGSGQEYYTAGNLHVSGNGGPGNCSVRAGIFATATSSRQQAGASYWGIMELSGNVWERTVTIASAGGGFTGLHGDGKLNGNGNADVSAWPGLVGGEVTDKSGAGYRGSAWVHDETYARVSSRIYAASETTWWGLTSSGRGVRSAPSGVGP